MIWSISRDDKRFRKRTEDEKLFSVVQVGKYLFWIQRPNQSNTFCSKTKNGGIINGRSAAHVRFPEYWLLFAICEMEGQVKLPLTCLSLRAPPCIGPKSCCSSGRSESPKVRWNCKGTPGRGRHNSLELGVLVVMYSFSSHLKWKVDLWKRQYQSFYTKWFNTLPAFVSFISSTCLEKSFGLREPEQIISVCYTLCYVLKMVIKAFYMP